MSHALPSGPEGREGRRARREASRRERRELRQAIRRRLRDWRVWVAFLAVTTVLPVGAVIEGNLWPAVRGIDLAITYVVVGSAIGGAMAALTLLTVTGLPLVLRDLWLKVRGTDDR